MPKMSDDELNAIQIRVVTNQSDQDAAALFGEVVYLRLELQNVMAENAQYRRRKVEEENGNLRAGMEAMQRSHMDDMGLAIEQRDKAYRELDETRLQIEELKRDRDGFHRHRDEALAGLTVAERLNEELQKKLTEIVGVMQGSMVDKEAFETVYRIAKGCIERPKDAIRSVDDEGKAVRLCSEKVEGGYCGHYSPCSIHTDKRKCEHKNIGPASGGGMRECKDCGEMEPPYAR